MVEQRLLGSARVAGMELDESAGDFDARRPGFTGLRRVEAVVAVPRSRLVGVGGEERDVVEVVVGLSRGLDEPDPDVVTEVEERHPVLPLDPKVVRKLGQRRVEVVHAQRHVLQRTAFARRFRVEERQLPLQRIATDEGEAIGALDNVHPDVVGEEARDAIAVLQPESDVIESLGAHGVGKDSYPTPCRGTCSSYLRRSTARWSCCLFIFERPAMFMRLASLYSCSFVRPLMCSYCRSRLLLHACCGIWTLLFVRRRGTRLARSYSSGGFWTLCSVAYSSVRRLISAGSPYA